MTEQNTAYPQTPPTGQSADTVQAGTTPAPANPPIPPFVPPRPQESHATKTQAKLIIILLICILVVNLAAFAVQIFQSRGISANRGVMTVGGNGTPPAFQQDGSQQEGTQ
jgi:hypothetical protein